VQLAGTMDVFINKDVFVAFVKL